VLYRWFYRAMTHPSQGGGGGNSRFWFVPSDVRLERSDDGESFVFDRTAVQLLTEDMLLGGGATDPDAENFARWFNNHFEDLANEQFTTYDYPSEGVGGEVPTTSSEDRLIFRRLEQVAKAIAFARFLYDNDIPIDFSWMENYEVPHRNTPLEARTVQNSMTGRSGGYEITITVTGGVTMETPNSYLEDTGAAADASNTALGDRPDWLAQQWTTNVGGQDLKAVALSLDSTHYDGLDQRADTDLAYQTAGEVPLGLTRYYNSASPTPGAFGYGWEFLPYETEFSMPEFFSSSRSPYTSLNGLRTGEVRITDRTDGRVLTFESSFVTERDEAGNFMYGGINADGVPDFTPGGSEQPDGSTLLQDPATHNYTLTRPDGTQAVLDNQGRLLQMVDARGRAVTYGYTGGRVTSIADAAGQTITLAYNGQGRVDQAAGLDGEVVNYAYDPAGNLTSADRVRDGVHITYSYAYDADHRVTSVTLPDQVSEGTSVADLMGRISTRTDTRGNQFDSSFDPVTRTAATTDATDGTTTERETDWLGRPTVVTDQLGQVTRYSYLRNYTAADVPMLIPDQETVTTSLEIHDSYTIYDVNVRLDALHTWDADLDIYLIAPDGTRVDLTTGNGGDGQHYLGTVFDDQAATSIVDGAAPFSGYFRPEGSLAVLNGMDVQGTWQLEVTDTEELADGILVGWSLDVVGLSSDVGQPAATGPQGANRQPSMVELPDPDRPPLMFLYDDNGNMTMAFDPERGGDSDYDGVDDNPLQFEYDSNNNLVRYQDARGFVTEYTYNEYNQRTSMTRAVGTANEATWNYEYDPATGFLVRETDPSGVVTEYDYDARGNLTTVTVAAGTPGETVTSYGYDVFSRRTSEQSQGRTTTYEYNGWDQVTSTILEGPPQLTSGSGYDADTGRKLSDTDYNGNVTEYQYDATTGDLVKQTSAVGTLDEAVTEFEYDRFGNMARIVDPAGNVTIFEYDELQRLTHTVSLGATPRVIRAEGSPTEIVIDFSEPIDTALIDDGADVYVQDSALQPVAGTSTFSVDGRTLTWAPDSGNLAQDVYMITLLATNTDEFTTEDGVLLDGEFSGMLPSGDGFPGGDFAYAWTVDDHGNDALHATLLTPPAVVDAELEFEGDADWFRLDAVAGSRFRFEVTLGSLPDSVLRLYGSDGKTVVEENDDIDVHTGQYGSRIEWEAVQTGTYYLSVGGYEDRHVGTYQLNVSLIEDDHADDSSNATGIGVPSVSTGHLEIPSDVDYFSFSATAGEEYRVAAILDSLEQATVTLYSTDGITPVVPDHDYGTSEAPLLYWTAPQAGTYYIAVRSLDGLDQGTYELLLSVDDHVDSSSDPTAATLGVSLDGNIEVKDDVDWFSFQLQQGGHYRIEAIPGPAPEGLDTALLALYDSNLNLVDLDISSTSPAVIYVTPTLTQTYFAEVFELGTGTGTYQFVATELIDDYGNDAASAHHVTVPSVTDGELEIPEDEDWFAFTALGGNRYLINVALVTLSDSYLTLYGLDGQTEIISNDDYQGLGSFIDWYAPDDGTYYVAVTSYGGNYAGEYSLSIEEAQVETIPPDCALMSPRPGSYTNQDLGYLDFTWDDLGGSGIDGNTVTTDDLEIAGLVFGSVEPRGSDTWRYHYTGSLPEGAVEVVVPAGRVADIAGNWNEGTTCTFSYDITSPTVNDRAPAPGTTINTSSVDVRVTFSEEVTDVDAADLVLSGTATASASVGTPEDQGGNTWSFPVSGLVPGTLLLSLAPDPTDIMDLAGNDLANITWDYLVQWSEASIVGRHIFYNNSAWDGNDPAANANDDNAIAPPPPCACPKDPLTEGGKQALLPGETATFVNYTSYSKGINGVMVDINGLPATPVLADFQFRVGNDNNPDGWSTAPDPQSVTAREVDADGDGNTDFHRVTIIWADNDWMTPTPEPGAIAKQWLQVTVLATANTGLAEDDVFYFGNAIGESGNSTACPYDYNRDKKADATDQIIARNNQTFFLNDLNLITVPASAGGSAAGLLAMATFETASSDVKAADTSRMDEETEVRAAAQPLVIAAAIHDATAYRGKADLEVAECRRARRLTARPGLPGTSVADRAFAG